MSGTARSLPANLAKFRSWGVHHPNGIIFASHCCWGRLASWAVQQMMPLESSPFYRRGKRLSRTRHLKEKHYRLIKFSCYQPQRCRMGWAESCCNDDGSCQQLVDTNQLATDLNWLCTYAAVDGSAVENWIATRQLMMVALARRRRGSRLS